jgi:hypothetical protein
MIALGMSPDNVCYPPLTLKDTFRKATYSKHAVGDSQCFDGLAWTHTSVNGGSCQVLPTSTTTISLSGLNPGVGTQAIKAKRNIIFCSSVTCAFLLNSPLGPMSLFVKPRYKGKNHHVEDLTPLTVNNDEDAPKGA